MTNFNWVAIGFYFIVFPIYLWVLTEVARYFIGG